MITLSQGTPTQGGLHAMTLIVNQISPGMTQAKCYVAAKSQVCENSSANCKAAHVKEKRRA